MLTVVGRVVVEIVVAAVVAVDTFDVKLIAIVGGTL